MLSRSLCPHKIESIYISCNGVKKSSKISHTHVQEKEKSLRNQNQSKNQRSTNVKLYLKKVFEISTKVHERQKSQKLRQR